MMSDEQKPIILQEAVIEQRTMSFLGDELIAALTTSGIYVTLPGMCRAMGLNTQSQLRRILNTNRLRPGLRELSLLTRGGMQQVNCLNAQKVALWLAGIETSKASATFATKIDEYHDRLEPLATRVFADVMGLPVMPNMPTLADPRLAALVEQYDTLIDVALFLKEHMDALATMPGQMSTMAQQLDQAVMLLESLAERQDSTEDAVAKIAAKTQGLTPAQQAQIRNAIEIIARDSAGKPQAVDYAQIYAALKRRFHVASYKQISDTRYEEVLQYLRELWRHATSNEQPEQSSLF